jgi:putative tryptophan/tyrosine transport system substrate-binding protein
LAAWAQGTPVIGYLGAETPEVSASRLAAFREGLAEMSFAEGRNVAIEFRWANGDNAKLPELAVDLVQRKVSVLVASGSVAAALAAKKATATLPIVFEVGVDPVAVGLVRSMSRPGGNATGVTSLNTQVGPRRLQLLSDLAPGAKSFAVLVNPTNSKNDESLVDDLQVTAHVQRVQLQIVRAATEQDLPLIFENLARQHVGGLVIANDPFFSRRYEQLGSLALKARIPTIHPSREFVAAGGLISYGAKVEQSPRLAGLYTGRILQGERPAQLPVQQASQLELYVNLRTAKALGIHVPQSVLSRADGMIE